MVWLPVLGYKDLIYSVRDDEKNLLLSVGGLAKYIEYAALFL
jgi:hypothetical protein